MLNDERKGSRCWTKKLIVSPTGVINPATEGTIAFEVENLGRQLIALQWNDGPMTYVFLDEIEIGDRDGLPSVR